MRRFYARAENFLPAVLRAVAERRYNGRNLLRTEQRRESMPCNDQMR
jgi:hypothetical protein